MGKQQIHCSTSSTELADQIFGQTLQSARTEAPSLLDSPAISNSPQSNPVIASELQKPPQIQTEELPNGNSNGDSTGCPTPNNVAGSSINSTESSTLGVVLAARKAFDMENNYLMNARHHGYIAQQIQVNIEMRLDFDGRKVFELDLLTAALILFNIYESVKKDSTDF